MQYKRKIIASLLIGSGIISAPLVASANDSTELEELRALVQELDQKVRVLARQNEVNAEDAAALKKETPVVSASERGFGIKSADGKNELRLRGAIQVDGRYYPGGDAIASGNTDANAVHATDGFNLKQFRPILQGTLWGKYDFLLTPDFGSGKVIIKDAYIDAKFNNWFQVKVGKQKSPFGIERLQGDADVRFTERSLTQNLAPDRDIGIQIHGALADGLVDYSAGVFNGVIDGSSSDSFTTSDTDNNKNKDFAARIFATPFKNDPGFLQGLGFGLAATFGTVTGAGNNGTTTLTSNESNLPSFKSGLGQQKFFGYRTTTTTAIANTAAFADGDRTRWSPQFYYYNGPFGLLGEYVHVDQDVTLYKSSVRYHDKIGSDAWEITAAWLLTGEDEGYGQPNVKNPFDPEKGTGWGAWELVARYSELNIDDSAFALRGGAAKVNFADPQKSANSAQSWAVGVNWYLNRNLKLALGYERTSFDGGWAPTTVGSTVLDRPSENAITTRLQIGF